MPESSKDPIFKLYESSIDAYSNLLRIISYLDLEITVLTNAVNRMEVLLLDSKQYGYLKQQADGELTVLKNIKEHLISVIDKLTVNYSIEREKIENINKRTKELEDKILKAQESQNQNLSEQKKLSVFEERIGKLERERESDGKDDKVEHKTHKKADGEQEVEDDEDDEDEDNE